MNDFSMLNMMQVCDSLFPIGTFTQSNGFETFVQKEKVNNSTSFKQYVENYVKNMAYNDLMAVCLTYENAQNAEKLIEFDNLYSAFKNAREIREGSEKLCKRFIKVLEKIKEYPFLNEYSNLITNKTCYGHHPFAVGIFMKDMGFDLETGLTMFAYSSISNTITNGVKIIPLSQLEGQKILNEIFPLISASVKIAMEKDLCLFGANCVGMEIYSMAHETLYSRLYMS